MSIKRERRKAAAKLRKKGRGRWVRVDLSKEPYVPEWMSYAYRNNYYTVMVEGSAVTSKGIAKKVMVQAHNNLPIRNHWAELQRIKNELFGPEVTAVEYYPPESQLVDEQNIYWLWIFPDGVLPVTLGKK